MVQGAGLFLTQLLQKQSVVFVVSAAEKCMIYQPEGWKR